MKLGRGLEVFLDSKRGELASDSTIKYYNHWVKDFLRYEAGNGVVSWEDIEASHIQAYFSMLKDVRKVKPSTIHDAYRAIRACDRFLYKRGDVPRRVVDDVQAPRQEKKIPRTFTPKEINAMFGACNKFTFAGIRDRTMIRLLLSSGIRKSELAGILSENVDLEQGTIKVYGKGKKERILPIATKAKKAIIEYEEARNRQNFPIKSKYYFVSTKGAYIRSSAMSSIFKRIKEKSGLKGERVSCHTWRHTFAKSYLMNGGDVFSLQRLLGHSDLTTTKRYLNLNNKEVATQFDKYNPLDNLDWML